MRRTAVLTATALGAFAVLSAMPAANAAAGSTVQVYLSSESRTAGYEPKNPNWYTNPATGLAGTPYQLSRQADLPASAASGSATITVDTNTQYQSMLGVGSSLEESTVYNLSRMSAAARDSALRKLVDPASGAGFDAIRITFGTPDFTSHAFYSYDDGASDPALSRFSIQQDINYHVVSVLQQALAINPNIKFFASAWSPPGWMKDNSSLIGGHLLTSAIPALATYYRKAIQAYAAQGVPIYGLTLGNEPEFSGSYPSTLITADQERQLAVALRTELTGNGLGATKIWAFDHNFSDGPAYAAGVLGTASSHSNAYSSVDGIAFHDYAGDPSAMSTVKSSYPDKDVLMTERSVWGTAGADRLIQYFRNNSTLYEGWVSMLDQNHAPTQWPGVPDPTMLVQSTSNHDTFWALPDYYLTAQFSKFVQFGAKRVASNNGGSASTTNVAFLNPDGTLVTVVVNQTSSNQPITVRVGSQQFTATLPAKAVGTYLWAGATSGTGTAHTGQIVGYGGKCVDVAGAGSANGTAIQLYTCNGTSAQQWTAGTDGTVRALGKCLDVAGASSANGTKVQLYDCNGTAAQQWTASGGTLQALGKCLDATGVSSADGTLLQIWSCGGGANQQWTLPS